MHLSNCERCGAQIRLAPSQVGRRRFCSRECQYEGHRAVTLACEHCGKSYQKPAAYQERSRFCSRRCLGLHFGEKQTATALIERACLSCGQPFQTTQHHGGKKTCSPECRKARYSTAPTERDSKKVVMTCETCGSQKQVFPCRVRRFCSISCSAKANIGTVRSVVTLPCGWCGKAVTKRKSRLTYSSQLFCNRTCYKDWDRQHKNSPEMRERLAERIRNGGFGKSSGVEDTVAAWMDERGIEYERQHTLRPFYTLDFRVGSVMVEVHGCYWHGCPEHNDELSIHQRKRQGRDAALSTFCANRSIPLLVIWEHDIRQGDFSALTPLLSTGSTSG
jgi:G:T-mismatch repair DNA endonuclease (very short patch repair protein)